MSSTGEKLRALFLAFVMVASIMAAGVAFSGSAAAAGVGDGGVDDSDPTIVDAEVPGSTGSSVVFLSFDEGVFTSNDATGSLESGDISLQQNLGGNTISTIEHTPGSAIARITFQNSITTINAGDDITVDDGEIFDASGNNANGETVALTDDGSPSIAAVEAEDGSSQITVTFTEPVNDGSDAAIEAADLSYNGGGTDADEILSVSHSVNTPTLTATLGDGSGNVQAATQTNDLASDSVGVSSVQDISDQDATGTTNLLDSTVPLIDNANTVDSNDDGNVERIDIQMTEPINDDGGTDFDDETFTLSSGSVQSISTSNDRSGADDSFVSLSVTGVGASDTPDITIESNDIVAPDGKTLANDHTFTNTETGVQVSASPSSATRGETVNLDVTLENIDDSTFTNNAQVAVLGLTNADDDGNPNADNTVSTVESRVLKTGSTTSGTFTTSITLNGQDADGFPGLMDEYFVVVRKGGTSFSTGAADDVTLPGSNPYAQDNNNDDGLLNDIQGSTVVSAGPNITSTTSSVERGGSSSVSGSVTISDESGIADFPISIRNVNASSQLKTASTADNGDFATSVTFDDAATYATAANLFDADINRLQFETDATFEVTPNDASISGSNSPVASIRDSSLSFDTTIDDAAPNANNVTFVELSGVPMSKLDVDAGGNSNEIIKQVTLTNGNTFGTVPESGTNGNTYQDDNEFPGGFDTSNDDEFIPNTPLSNSPNIQSAIVRVGFDGTNTLDFDARFEESGTLNVETRVEEEAAGDGATTSQQPDFVGSTTTNVQAPKDVNVLLSQSSAEASAGTIGNFDVTVIDNDGNGLTNTDPAADGRITSVTFSLEGNGTEFSVEAGDGSIGTDDGADAGPSFSNFGDNLQSTEVTVTEDDINDASNNNGPDADGSADTSTFRIEDLRLEQNGTVDVTVTANIEGGPDEATDTASFTLTDSDNVNNLSGGERTVGTTENISLQVTDGDGTPLNNRIVAVYSGGGTVGANDDLFSVDPDGDGTFEQTSVDMVQINGQANEVQFETSGGNTDANDASSSITVNNGEYVVENVRFSSSGNDIAVEVFDGTDVSTADLKAQFPKQFQTQGEQAFNVTSDVDPMVAGFSEQVNLTVTNASTGAVVNGTDLDSLLSGDSGANPEDKDAITQGTNPAPPGGVPVAGDFGTGDSVDTNGDGTVDAIQVSFEPHSTSTLNISIDNGDDTKIGTGTIDVVEPDVQTNITDGSLTQRINATVEVEIIDPRSGERLNDDPGTSPDIRFESFNGTVEVSQADPTNDINEIDDGESLDQADDGYLDEVSEGNQTFTLQGYPKAGDDGPFSVELSARYDFTGGNSDQNHFGDTNISIEPQQTSATPNSVQIGDQSTLEVVVEDANGNALANRRVDIIGAGVSITNANTDSSGFLGVQVDPSATGNINIFTASDPEVSTTDDIGDGNDDQPPTIQNQRTQVATVDVTTEQSEFDVTVDPQTVTANTTTTVTVTATNNASGDAVEGASVDLSGAGVNESAQTDANGEAAIDVTASETGTIEVTVNDAGFNSATETITVEAEPEPGAVQIDNVNLDPNSVTANTTNDHDLTFDALNVSADNSTDSFTVEIPSAATLESANDVTVTTENVSAQNLAVDGNNITFDVNPDSESVDVDLSVEANVTVSAPNVSQETTADLTINATDSDGSSDSASATLTITVEEAAEDAPANFSVSDLEPQDATVNVSEAFDVSATVENTGDLQGEQEIELRLEPDGDAVRNQTVSLDAGENDTVTFENVTVDTAGEFNHTVASANDSATGSLTVEQREQEQEQEPSVSVNFTDQTVPNGTEEVTVDSANFTRADGSAGDYVVVVHVVNDDEFDGGLDNSISAPVGASGNLSDGAENITVDLNSSAAFEDGDALDSITENVTLRAMLHTTDNDSAFGTRLGNAIDGIEPGDETDDATITVEQQEQVNRSIEVGRRIAGDDNVIGAFELLDAVDEFRNGEIDPFVLLELIDFFRNETDLSQV